MSKTQTWLLVMFIRFSLCIKPLQYFIPSSPLLSPTLSLLTPLCSSLLLLFPPSVLPLICPHSTSSIPPSHLFIFYLFSLALCQATTRCVVLLSPLLLQDGDLAPAAADNDPGGGGGGGRGEAGEKWEMGREIEERTERARERERKCTEKRELSPPSLFLLTSYRHLMLPSII